MVAAVSAGGAGPYSDPLAISTLAGSEIYLWHNNTVWTHVRYQQIMQ